MDTSTPAGKMVFTVLGVVAELERSLIVERVRAGIRNARAKGKRLGGGRASLWTAPELLPYVHRQRLGPRSARRWVSGKVQSGVRPPNPSCERDCKASRISVPLVHVMARQKQMILAVKNCPFTAIPMPKNKRRVRCGPEPSHVSVRPCLFP